MDKSNTRTKSQKGNQPASSRNPPTSSTSDPLAYFGGEDPDDIDSDSMSRALKKVIAEKRANGTLPKRT